jgi:hypothetical protein
MKNIKKRSIDTKRQKHRYNMFIMEQRGFAKIDKNPCNHYKWFGRSKCDKQTKQTNYLQSMIDSKKIFLE